MLQKANRIRKTKEYDHIFKEGKSFKTPYFSLIIRKVQNPKEGESYPKFGFIASKKVGGAVERNKAKRLLREAVKANIDIFPKNSELAIVAFSAIKNASLEDLKKIFAEVLRTDL